MRKLLILTAVVMLTSSAVGCRCCDWLWRGGLCNPCAPAVTCGDPCPVYSPCDPCTTGTQVITPGPIDYGPGTIP